MGTEGEISIPDSGAVFTFGQSKFAENRTSHFFIRNDPIIDIACGEDHTMVVCENGRILGFGGNQYGQVGLGHKTLVVKPTCVKALKPNKVAMVACGKYHTLACTESGKLYSWGDNEVGQLGLGDTGEASTSPSMTEENSIFKTHITQLAAGNVHSVALTYGGNVYVWGSNSEGQLGLGEGVKKVKTPTLLSIKDVIIQIACGSLHTVLLTDKQNLLVFGDGKFGKLGLGGNNSVSFPIPVGIEVPSGQIIGITAGGHHSLAYTDDGVVFAWGDNGREQLGFPVSENCELNKPTVVSALVSLKVKKVFCGERYTVFITDKEEVYVCGDDNHGCLLGEFELRTNPSKENSVIRKVNALEGLNAQKVACGGKHTIVLAKMDRNYVAKLSERNGNLPSPLLAGRKYPALNNLEVNPDSRDIVSPPPLPSIDGPTMAPPREPEDNDEDTDSYSKLSSSNITKSPSPSLNNVNCSQPESPIHSSSSSNHNKENERLSNNDTAGTLDSSDDDDKSEDDSKMVNSRNENNCFTEDCKDLKVLKVQHKYSSSKEAKPESMMSRIFGKSKQSEEFEAESSTSSKPDDSKTSSDDPSKTKVKIKQKDYRANNGVPPNKYRNRSQTKNSKMCRIL